MLHDDIQEIEEEDDDSFEDYLLDIKDYNENESYDDETDNS
jgi:hypothetical protein